MRRRFVAIALAAGLALAAGSGCSSAPPPATVSDTSAPAGGAPPSTTGAYAPDTHWNWGAIIGVVLGVAAVGAAVAF